MVECTKETISIEFQLGHVSSDMDRKAKREVHDANYRFQLGHFLAEMDRLPRVSSTRTAFRSFNWATS